MSAVTHLSETPTTGERLCRTYDLLMYVTSLTAVIKTACEGAQSHEGQQLKNTVDSIGFTLKALNRMVLDAAEDVESCEEYKDTTLDYLQRGKVPPSCNT